MFHFVLKRYLGSNLGFIWDLFGIYLGFTFVVFPFFRSEKPPHEPGNEAVLAAVAARATQESAL